MKPKSLILKIAPLLIFAAIVLPGVVFAQGSIEGNVDLISPIGQQGSSVNVKGAGLGNYINSIYLYAIGLGALLAMAVIIFGAIRYMTERGAPFKQSDAKTWIFGGIIGLIILLSATLILTTLNKGISDLSLTDQAVESANELAAGAGAEHNQASQGVIDARQAAVQDAKKKEVLGIAARGMDPYPNQWNPNSRPDDVDPLVWTASQILDAEYALYDDETAIAGFWEGLQEAFKNHPGLREAYFNAKAKRQGYLAREDKLPTSRLDEKGLFEESDYKIINQYHYSERYAGTNHEIDEVDTEAGARVNMWEILEEISQYNDVEQRDFLGHQAAKNGVYDAFVKQVKESHNDPNVTPRDFLRHMYEEGHSRENNWLVERIEDEIKDGRLGEND
ncbi:MAG: hypothetical protein Q8Q32_01190 [bacterium]|nr:hypothetical protein [bacterium]